MKFEIKGSTQTKRNQFLTEKHIVLLLWNHVGCFAVGLKLAHKLTLLDLFCHPLFHGAIALGFPKFLFQESSTASA